MNDFEKHLREVIIMSFISIIMYFILSLYLA